VKVPKSSTLESSPEPHYAKAVSGHSSNRKTPEKLASSSSKQAKNARHYFPVGLRILAAGTLGLASALMLWEGILRLAVESSQGISDHPALGKVDNPGPMLHTREGFNRTRLNSLGMRAAEPTAKLPGEYRILMLGDSFTRADEVSDGINFSDRLQANLTANLTAPKPSEPSDGQSIQSIQVINTGKPSASPAGYLYAADFHQTTFAPDSTVIQLTEHDFIMDMSNDASEFYLEKADLKKADLKKADETSYQVRHNESFGSAEPLAQKAMTYAPWTRSLMQMSTLRIGGRNLSRLLSPTEAEPVDAAPLTSAELKSAQTEDAAMVRWTVQQLNQRFPNAVLLFIPSMNYKDAANISSDPRNAALEKALTEASAAQGVPLINMRADFLAHDRTLGTHLNGFNNTVPGQGHLNSAGHQLVAQRLVDFYKQPTSPLANSLATSLANPSANSPATSLANQPANTLTSPLRRN
jgi:hypothetical protein